jgi:hypothetical protein
LTRTVAQLGEAKIENVNTPPLFSPTSFESILNELDSETDTPNAEAHSPSYLDDPKSDKRLAKRVLPPPERMVTRGVSGAIRHRSVDEILSAAEVYFFTILIVVILPTNNILGFCL